MRRLLFHVLKCKKTCTTCYLNAWLVGGCEQNLSMVGNWGIGGDLNIESLKLIL